MVREGYDDDVNENENERREREKGKDMFRGGNEGREKKGIGRRNSERWREKDRWLNIRW